MDIPTEQIVWRDRARSVGVVTRLGVLEGRVLVVTHAQGRHFSISMSDFLERFEPEDRQTPLTADEAGFSAI